MPLSEEEKSKLLARMEEDYKEEQERYNSFVAIDYHNYSLEEKIKHWAGTLHTRMRYQAEAGLDPYAIYSIGWYEKIKEREPNLDLIMEQVIQRYWGTGVEWSKEEYLVRTGQV